MDSEKSTSTYTRDRSGLTLDEMIGSLFQPDPLLPFRYFETLRRNTIFEPERRLMLAILEDALHCFQDNLLAHDQKRRRLFYEAQEWIVEANSDSVFSFENVCDALGLNAAYLRQRLLRWMRNKLFKYGQDIVSSNTKDTSVKASLKRGRKRQQGLSDERLLSSSNLF